jgi:hypothetical protein
VDTAPVGAHPPKPELSELVAQRGLGPFGGGGKEAHGRQYVDPIVSAARGFQLESS